MNPGFLTRLTNNKKQVGAIGIFLLHVGLLGVWILLHIPLIFFGSNNLPLHSAYIGDEQSPVNGALHVLNDLSLFSLHNLETLYYGPIFAVLAIPGVLMDALIFFVTKGSVNPQSYQMHLLYDWGGITVWVRGIALIFSYLGIVALFKILSTKIVNPQQSKKLAILGVIILASNFYFFSYGGMFKHWVFIITPFLWQIYILILQNEEGEYKAKYNLQQALLGVFAFGVSHISILSQALLVPYFFRCLSKRKSLSNFFAHYLIPYVTGSLLVIWWHPFAFFRYFKMFSGGVAKIHSEDFALLSTVVPVNAFWYYAEVLLFNHICIIISLFILLIISIRKLSSTLYQLVIGVTLVGLLYMILFSNFDIVVARYALFPIVSMIVVFAVLALSQWTELSKVTKYFISGFILLQVIYHVTSIIGWSNYLNQGPADREIVAEIVAISKKSDKNIYIKGENLFGWPHSTSSLAAFAALTSRTDNSLYKAYSTSKPPKTELLNVTYLGNKNEAPEGFVVECIDPIASGVLEPDYPEGRLYRFWSGNTIWRMKCSIDEQ